MKNLAGPRFVKPAVQHALSCQCMRPYATSVWALKVPVHEALSYSCMRLLVYEATSVWALKVPVHEALSYSCMRLRYVIQRVADVFLDGRDDGSEAGATQLWHLQQLKVNAAAAPATQLWHLQQLRQLSLLHLQRSCGTCNLAR